MQLNLERPGPCYGLGDKKRMLTKTINGLFRVGLPLCNKIGQWMSCRPGSYGSTKLRTGPLPKKRALKPSYRALSIPPAQCLGYILSHLSYTSSVRLSVRDLVSLS